jgi:hypothetical protein
MTYTAKVAVCSDIRTKHSPQSEHHVEILNVKPGGSKETLGFKRLILLCDWMIYSCNKAQCVCAKWCCKQRAHTHWEVTIVIVARY